MFRSGCSISVLVMQMWVAQMLRCLLAKCMACRSLEGLELPWWMESLACNEAWPLAFYIWVFAHVEESTCSEVICLARMDMSYDQFEAWFPVCYPSTDISAPHKLEAPLPTSEQISQGSALHGTGPPLDPFTRNCTSLLLQEPASHARATLSFLMTGWSPQQLLLMQEDNWSGNRFWKL